MFGTGGLVELSTDELQLLLRAVHRGELSCPVDRIGLATVGLLRIGDHIGILGGLDERGVKAVLISVLAERRSPGGKRRHIPG